MSRRAILSSVGGIIIACVSVILCASRCAAKYAFSPVLRVEADAFGQYGPSVAVDSLGNPCLVWWTELGEIHFARSTDGGESFVPSVVFDSFGIFPALTLGDGDNPHITWQGGGRRVMYTKSTDGGQTFLPPIYVTSDSFRTTMGSKIAVDKDENPMLVWYATPAGLMKVVFTISHDGGITFDSPIIVDPHPGHQKSPDIALADDGTIHICYLGDTPFVNPYLFATRSTDGGATFSDRLCVDQDSADNGPCSITVVPASGDPWTGQGVVMVTWPEQRVPGQARGAYFCRSTNAGISFGDVVPVSQPPSKREAFRPAVASDIYGTPVVAWVEDNDVYYSYSLDGGVSFLPGSPVDPETLSHADQPDIAIDRWGTLMIAWSDIRRTYSPIHQIYFTTGKRVTGADEDYLARDRSLGLTLGQNSPNPFNRSTVISYELSAEGHATLNVYDTAGRLVRTLVHGEKKAGLYRTEWDGKDQHGRTVGSGVYFYSFHAGSFADTRKMILFR
jgi:hypothetical protein